MKNLNDELLEICQRISKAMSDNKMSYGELANATGIPKSALHRYATGETPKIPLDRIKAISLALNVSAEWIMGWEGTPDGLPAPRTTDDYTTFPVIGDVAAGYDSIAIEDWEGDVIDVPNSYLKGRDISEFFVLRIKGDSMYPIYQEDDRVLILKQSSLNHSGDVGVILYDDELATLKKVEYVKGEDWMKLIPINPVYPPKTITGESLEHCKVIGIPKLLIREMQ